MSGRDVPAGRLAIAGAAIAGTVLGAVALALLWLHLRHMPPGGERLAQPYEVSIPAPRLQSAPQLDLAAYRKDKAHRLNSLGWVDASRGIAHIPIDDAMALMAARSASAPKGR